MVRSKGTYINLRQDLRKRQQDHRNDADIVVHMIRGKLRL